MTAALLLLAEESCWLRLSIRNAARVVFPQPGSPEIQRRDDDGLCSHDRYVGSSRNQIQVSSMGGWTEALYSS